MALSINNKKKCIFLHSHLPMAITVNSLIRIHCQNSSVTLQQEGVNCKEEVSFSPGFLAIAMEGVGKFSSCSLPLDSRAPEVLCISGLSYAYHASKIGSF